MFTDSTVPEDTVVEATLVEDTVVDDTVPEDTVVEDTVPEDTVVEDTVPEDAVVDDTVPEDTVVESTLVEDTVVDDTVPEDTVVEDTAPADVVVGVAVREGEPLGPAVESAFAALEAQQVEQQTGDQAEGYQAPSTVIATAGPPRVLGTPGDANTRGFRIRSLDCLADDETVAPWDDQDDPMGFRQLPAPEFATSARRLHSVGLGQRGRLERIYVHRNKRGTYLRTHQRNAALG